jgi:hypothetical protein
VLAENIIQGKWFSEPTHPSGASQSEGKTEHGVIKMRAKICYTI